MLPHFQLKFRDQNSNKQTVGALQPRPAPEITAALQMCTGSGHSCTAPQQGWTVSLGGANEGWRGHSVSCPPSGRKRHKRVSTNQEVNLDHPSRAEGVGAPLGFMQTPRVHLLAERVQSMAGRLVLGMV